MFPHLKLYILLRYLVVGIDVMLSGEDMTGGHIVTHVLSKDYTMSCAGELGIILVFGTNYTYYTGGRLSNLVTISVPFCYQTISNCCNWESLMNRNLILDFNITTNTSDRICK